MGIGLYGDTLQELWVRFDLLVIRSSNPIGFRGKR